MVKTTEKLQQATKGLRQISSPSVYSDFKPSLVRDGEQSGGPQVDTTQDADGTTC